MGMEETKIGYKVPSGVFVVRRTKRCQHGAGTDFGGRWTWFELGCIL